MKKLLSLVLTICIVASMIVPSFAAEISDDEVVSPYASSYIAAYNVGAAESTEGYFTARFWITSPSTMTWIGATNVYIQKYNGSYWYNYKSYNYEDHDIYETNASYCSRIFNVTSITSGTYRLKVIFYASNSSGSDTRTVYSTSITL